MTDRPWWRAVVRRAAAVLGGPRRRRARGPGRAAFRLQYERFREILARNEAVLGLIAELEERRASDRPFALATLSARVRAAAMDAFVMAKNLNQIGGNRWPELYAAVERLDTALATELAGAGARVDGGEIVPLARIRRRDAPLAGLKMATLGETAAAGFNVPPGFVLTAAAFARVMDEAGLWERALRLEQVLELHGPTALSEAAAEVQKAIMDATLPDSLIQGAATAAAAPELAGRLLAIRSSAVGEDAASASHAGLYCTLLGVSVDGLADAYRQVLASAFSALAVTYRYERGLAVRDAAMAVGVMAMIDATAAGVLFTRAPEDPGADASVLAMVAGTGEALVGGLLDGRTVRISDPGSTHDLGPLGREQVHLLVATGRRLETLLGHSLDVEWAFDRGGRLWILQARPLVEGPMAAPATPLGGPILLEGGATACPGIGAGPVVLVEDDTDLEGFVPGGVLVARHSSARFARVLGRCSAIVTEVGSPAGHLAILAREAAVPALVGVGGARAALAPGQLVTVDASTRRVIAGASAAPGPRRRRTTTPAHRILDSAARLVSPLHLTDPDAPDFTPEGCRSLHDVARFVHEKCYDVMFHYRELAGEEHGTAAVLQARLPLKVLLFDVGGGLAPAGSAHRTVAPAEVTSDPFNAFLTGLLDPAIRWDSPRPVSVRGFMTVLGSAMAGPPPEAQGVGRPSYAIVSDRYLNFSTKAGYHFATVDSSIGAGGTGSYVHFRFSGGGADLERRERRVQFLAQVLRAMGFVVLLRADVLVARLDKESAELVRSCLAALGRLILCARQLDMLMDSDASPAFFVDAFLDADWTRF